MSANPQAIYPILKIRKLYKCGVFILILGKTSAVFRNLAITEGKWHYETRLKDNDGNGEFSNGDTLIVSITSSKPVFQNGDKVVFSITGYNDISVGGVVEF